MTDEERADCIARMARLPELLKLLVQSLSADQLLARPLAGEWSVAQNVHHLADSHMNAYIRTRLILTEEQPALKPYLQEKWAELPDATTVDLTPSLEILVGLHKRWTMLFANLPEDAWLRTGYHPESKREVTIESILSGYADHGEGHLGQIERTLAAQTHA